MSSRRLRIQILETARNQLSEILLYTEREWGQEQQLLYSQRFAGIIDLLASNPDLGRNRDDLSMGLRSYPFDSHAIYYWSEGDILVVARVLHRRQWPTGGIR